MEGSEEQLRSVKRCGCELKRLRCACRQQNRAEPPLQLGSYYAPPAPQFQLLLSTSKHWFHGFSEEDTRVPGSARGPEGSGGRSLLSERPPLPSRRSAQDRPVIEIVQQRLAGMRAGLFKYDT